MTEPRWTLGMVSHPSNLVELERVEVSNVVGHFLEPSLHVGAEDVESAYVLERGSSITDAGTAVLDVAGKAVDARGAAAPARCAAAPIAPNPPIGETLGARAPCAGLQAFYECGAPS